MWRVALGDGDVYRCYMATAPSTQNIRSTPPTAIAKPRPDIGLLPPPQQALARPSDSTPPAPPPGPSGDPPEDDGSTSPGNYFATPPWRVWAVPGSVAHPGLHPGGGDPTPQSSGPPCPFNPMAPASRRALRQTNRRPHRAPFPAVIDGVGPTRSDGEFIHTGLSEVSHAH